MRSDSYKVMVYESNQLVEVVIVQKRMWRKILRVVGEESIEDVVTAIAKDIYSTNISVEISPSLSSFKAFLDRSEFTSEMGLRILDLLEVI